MSLDPIKSINKSRIVKKKALKKQFQAEVNELLTRYFPG